MNHLRMKSSNNGKFEMFDTALKVVLTREGSFSFVWKVVKKRLNQVLVAMVLL